jgi:hypothetical protein
MTSLELMVCFIPYILFIVTAALLDNLMDYETPFLMQIPF